MRLNHPAFAQTGRSFSSSSNAWKQGLVAKIQAWNQYTRLSNMFRNKMLTSRKSNFTPVIILVLRDGTLLAKTLHVRRLSLCLRFENYKAGHESG